MSIKACPTCGEPLEATAVVYLSNVTLGEDTLAITGYDIAYELGDTPDGLVFTHEAASVYCPNDHTQDNWTI